MKKNLKKVVLLIILILLIVLIVFGVSLIRKYIIINKIVNNMNSIDISNYYCKVENSIDENSKEEGFEDWHIYKSYNNIKVVENPSFIYIKTDEKSYGVVKYNGYYVEGNEQTEEIVNNSLNTVRNYFNYLNDAKTFKDKLGISLHSNIKEKEFNNIDCYAITLNYKTDNGKESITIYIDKESLVRIAEEIKVPEENASIQEFITYYDEKIGTQKEEDFLLENLLSGYELKETNN